MGIAASAAFRITTRIILRRRCVDGLAPLMALMALRRSSRARLVLPHRRSLRIVTTHRAMCGMQGRIRPDMGIWYGMRFRRSPILIVSFCQLLRGTLVASMERVALAATLRYLS